MSNYTIKKAAIDFINCLNSQNGNENLEPIKQNETGSKEILPKTRIYLLIAQAVIAFVLKKFFA